MALVIAMPLVAMRRRGRQIETTARPAAFIAGRADVGLVDHAADLLFSLFPPFQTRDEKKGQSFGLFGVETSPHRVGPQLLADAHVEDFGSRQ